MTDDSFLDPDNDPWNEKDLEYDGDADPAVEYEDDGEFDSFEALIGFDETPELEDEYEE